MTESNQTNTDHFDTCSDAALLRAHADGEPVPQDRLEAARGAVDDAERRMAFERELRTCCGRAMKHDECRVPESLAARVREAIAADEGAVAGGINTPEAAANVSETPLAASFWSAASAPLAIAAAMILAVVGVFMITSGSGSSGFQADLASFAIGEHNRTLDADAAAAKFRQQDLAGAINRVRDHLGADSFEGLAASDAIALSGSARCKVPGKGPSSHLRYSATRADGSTEILSVFVKRNEGEIAVMPGVVLDLGSEGHNVYVWTDGDLTYTLVAGSQAGPACDRVLEAAGVQPSPAHD